MSETKTTTKKITKAQRFADIRALVTGEGEVKFGTTAEIAAEFIDHELDLLSRKNTATGDRKPTETQLANEKYKAMIVDFMESQPDDFAATCTAIGNAIPALVAALGESATTSKFSSLCNALVNEGKMTKASVKGKTLFSLA